MSRFSRVRRGCNISRNIFSTLPPMENFPQLVPIFVARSKYCYQWIGRKLTVQSIERPLLPPRTRHPLGGLVSNAYYVVPSITSHISLLPFVTIVNEMKRTRNKRRKEYIYNCSWKLFLSSNRLRLKFYRIISSFCESCLERWSKFDEISRQRIRGFKEGWNCKWN